jgi:hypothetical protein
VDGPRDEPGSVDEFDSTRGGHAGAIPTLYTPLQLF